MKKIVLLTSSFHFSKSAFEFVQLLNEAEPLLLTGAFFHSIDYGVLIPMAFSHNASSFISFTDDERRVYKKNIEEFKNLCVKNNIDHTIHEESEEWKINELIIESRFADLIIVSGRSFFADIEKEQPNFFLKEVLSKSECPIIVVPEKKQFIKKVSIAYNGEKQSVYALKHFCYLFPEFANLPVDIFYETNKSNNEIPHLSYLKEFGGRHFSNLNFLHLRTDAANSTSSWIKTESDIMFVCGSYNGSVFSTWFKKSFAEHIIKEQSAYVFIAHGP